MTNKRRVHVFEFGIKDFIDILLVAFVLYYTYKLMKASGSIKVFTGILVLSRSGWW